jgi:RNA polymerase sigma-70 factor, ECF subfamily
VKAWSHFESFRAGTNLRAWHFTFLRNTYFSGCRVRRHEGEDPDGRKRDALCVPCGQEGYADLQDFRRMLNLISGEQREALILVGAAGYRTKKRRKSLDAQSGPSRARSTEHELS